MKQLFLFSGLGADKRVFDALDLNNFNLHHIEWPKPADHESLEDYAKKILPQIQTENPILIGVSFGGIVALEIAKLITVEKIIQISSATSYHAIPSYFRFLAKLKLERFMSPQVVKKPNEVLFWLFGVTRKEHRALLASIMADTDEIFFYWAIERIILWKNNAMVERVIQIHGTKDRILNLQTADFIIEGGGHFMVVTRAKEVSDILKGVLK